MFKNSNFVIKKHGSKFFITTLTVLVFALCVVGVFKVNNNNDNVLDSNEDQLQFNVSSNINSKSGQQAGESVQNKYIKQFDVGSFKNTSQNNKKSTYDNNGSKASKDISNAENIAYDNTEKENIINSTLKENWSQPDLTIEEGIEGVDYNWDLSWAEPKLNIVSGANVTIKNMDDVEESHTCVYLENKESTETTLSLDGVNIKSSIPILIADNSKGKVNIILSESNTLYATIGAGIEKDSDTSLLTIKSREENLISKKGELFVTGSFDLPGIGSDSNINVCNIVIDNTKITANGGDYAAGIGGTDNGSVNSMLISNSQITANGGKFSAGLGGGENGSVNSMTILNSQITANGGESSAGIGGGKYSSVNSMLISNSQITANGGEFAPGIGVGDAGKSENIIIDGGSVKGSISCQPKNLKGQNVYLLEFHNEKSLPVSVKNINTGDSFVDYGIINHKDLDPDDTNLYTFQPAINESDGLSIKLNNHDQNDYCFQNGEWTWIDPYPGDLQIDGGVYGKDYTYDKNKKMYTLNVNAVYYRPLVWSIKNKSEISNSQIYIKDNPMTTTTIKLNEVNIQSDNPIKFLGYAHGNFNIVLSGVNTITSTKGAGIEKWGNFGSGLLTIKSDKDSTGSFMGNLVVRGADNCAGIGSKEGQDTNNIVIDNAVVNAIGGKDAPGIGGGKNGTADSIEINNSLVTAKGNGDAADIGCINQTKKIRIKDSSVKGTLACQPTAKIEDKTVSVYPSVISNPNSDDVYINDVTTPYSVKNHEDLDGDANLYAYLPENYKGYYGALDIKIGDWDFRYVFRNNRFVRFDEKSELNIANVKDWSCIDYNEGNDEYIIKSNIQSSDPIKVTNRYGVDKPAKTRIVVKQDIIKVSMLLCGVNIESSHSPIQIEGFSSGEVAISLENGTTNRLKALDNGAAIEKNGSQGSLFINSPVTSDFSNTGKLYAEGAAGSAGIGSKEKNASGNIFINNCIINAVGGNNAAGIGGGASSSVNGIAIRNSCVAAFGNHNINNAKYDSKNILKQTIDSDAMDIGHGIDGISFNIVIDNSTVKANNIGCTPVNSEGKKVYLLTVNNPDNLDVSLDNNKLPFKQHDCITWVNNNLYLYIADNYTHSVRVRLGNGIIRYIFKNGVWASVE